MRIAVVSPLYESVPPALYGGTERVVSYLTEELVAQGHRVTPFASGDSRTSARLVAGCEKALRLYPSFCDPLIPHQVMLEQVLKMAREFDVIHLNTDHHTLAFARRSPVPVVMTAHGRLDLADFAPIY